MTRRTRSFLIDNTVGKIFTNVQTTSGAGADKLIAGTKLLVRTIAAAARIQAVPTLNLGGGLGILLSPNNAILTRIDIGAATAPGGQPLIISARIGTSFASSVEFGTYELPMNIKSAGYVVAKQFQPGEYLYVNILQTGTTRRAAGLSVRFSYYAG